MIEIRWGLDQSDPCLDQNDPDMDQPTDDPRLDQSYARLDQIFLQCTSFSCSFDSGHQDHGYGHVLA